MYSKGLNKLFILVIPLTFKKLEQSIFHYILTLVTNMSNSFENFFKYPIRASKYRKPSTNISY